MRTAIVLPAIVSLLVAAPASADDLLPTIKASIHDAPPDGLGDSFNTSPFEGLLRETSTQEDRAILEYDVSAFAGFTLTSATIAGTVFVNNAFDNGERTFDFLIYEGNGAAELTDFEIPADVVGSGSYAPPSDTSFDFSFDVLAEVQAIIDAGGDWVGLKVDPTSSPNFPNILDDETTLSLEGEPGNDCPADCNGDGGLSVLDFICFQGLFIAGDPGANCNGDADINILDFVCYQSEFAAGCP